MYDISFARKLDHETSGVVIGGKVVFTKPAKHVISPEGAERKYDFWSQFVLIEDDTGSMAANITFGDENSKLKNEDKVKLKGIIRKYIDEDSKEEKIILNKAKIVKPEEVKIEAKVEVKETKVTEVKSKTPVEVPVTDEIKEQGQVEKRSIRTKAIEISSNLVTTGKFACEKLFSFAERIVKYIYEGYKGDPKKNVEELEEKTGVEKTEIGKVREKEKLEVKVTPGEVLKALNKGGNFQTWKEVLYYATLADICPVESTEGDIQMILTDDNKLIQKVIDTKKYKVKEEEKERLEKEEAKAEKKVKDKEEEVEVDEYLKEISTKAKGIGLKTWKEIIYFAVKSDVFQPGIDVSEAKDRLFQHVELYNALLEAIEVSEDVKKNVQEEGYSNDIPF